MLAVVIIVALVAGIVAVGGGNTVDGFGADLKNTGQNIQNRTHQH
jgi:predicted small secreted protein